MPFELPNMKCDTISVSIYQRIIYILPPIYAFLQSDSFNVKQLKINGHPCFTFPLCEII